MEQGTAAPSPSVENLCDWSGDNIDELTLASAITELDRSIHRCKQGVILAQSNVFARLVSRAALANDDRATRHHFAPKYLDSKPLGVGVSPVFGAA